MPNENQFHTWVNPTELIRYLINWWKLLEEQNRQTPSVFTALCQSIRLSVLTSFSPAVTLSSFTDIFLFRLTLSSSLRPLFFTVLLFSSSSYSSRCRSLSQLLTLTFYGKTETLLCLLALLQTHNAQVPFPSLFLLLITLCLLLNEFQVSIFCVRFFLAV